jgi:hypothetical protein
MLAGDLLFTIDTRHHGGKQTPPPKGSKRPSRAPTTPRKKCKKETPAEMRLRFANLITPCWKKTTEEIFQMGDWLEEAFRELGEKEYSRMYGSGGPSKGKLPFEESVGRKLRGMSKKPWLRAKMHALPPCWSTIYELSQLDKDRFNTAVKRGKVRPSMRQKDAIKIKKERPPKPPPKINWPDSYTPPDTSDWFCTSRTVWDLAELEQASKMDWVKTIKEDGVTGVRAKGVGQSTPYSDKHSIFPGVLMEWECLRRLGDLGDPPARIIDPCAGGAVRGFVATVMGYEYHGIDISADQIGENLALCEDWPRKPHYYVGDGTKLGDHVDGEFDLLFTCPPYWNKEMYSGCDGDLSACETYDEFLEKMGQMARAARPLMKAGAFVCLVLGHVRDQSGKPPSRYLYIPAHVAECFEDAGFQMHQEIIIRGPDGSAAANAGALWTPYKYLVPVHQTMLVLQTP